MKRFSRCTLVAILLLLTACAEGNKDSGAVMGESVRAVETNKGRSSATYMAYTYNVIVELEQAQLLKNSAAILDACSSDKKFQCVLIGNDLSNGNYASSFISLRLLPGGVEYFSHLAEIGGAHISQSMRADDLADRIVDNQQRLEMLTNYRSKLVALEARGDSDIDALLKVASELAQVQTKLEFSQGKKAKLLQRVEADILNITLRSSKDRNFISPISDSFSGFGSQLSWGIASVVDSSAFIIPWVIFLILMCFCFRGLYRKFWKE